MKQRYDDDVTPPQQQTVGCRLQSVVSYKWDLTHKQKKFSPGIEVRRKASGRLKQVRRRDALLVKDIPLIKKADVFITPTNSLVNTKHLLQI